MLNNLFVRQLKCLFRGHAWKDISYNRRKCSCCDTTEFHHHVFGWVEDEKAVVGVDKNGFQHVYVVGRKPSYHELS